MENGITNDEFKASYNFIKELESLSDFWVDINKNEPFLDGQYLVKTTYNRIISTYYYNDFGIFTYNEGVEIGWKSTTYKEMVTHYKKIF
jgi:hypothetical protein